MTAILRRAVPALMLALAAPVTAAAQNTWQNPYTGRSFNNPGSSLMDTFLQNDMNRRMMQRQLGVPQAGAPGAAARGGDPSFRLTNRAATTLTELYVSPSQDRQWGSDRLGQGVLPSGQAFIVRLPAGMCENDIRAVFADGRVAERRGVDTCSLTDVALP